MFKGVEGNMGKACEVVEKIIRDRDNCKELGINTVYNRTWGPYNFLIGENGAGKSRILKLIKDNKQDECNVIYMDFSRLNIDYEQETKISSNSDLACVLIYNRDVSEKMKERFSDSINEQILDLFNALSDMMEQKNIQQSIAKEIIDEINIPVERMLHRKIDFKEGKLYLVKEGRIEEISSEWKLMSPGEKSLLVIALAALTISMMKEPCILLIDEIETHLHPLIQVEAVELIKRILKGRDHCTCIASHSIFLLSTFSMEEVVYIDKGEIQKINGVLYQQIYNKLVGEEESLSSFLKSVSSWQFAEYLAECFVLPSVVDTVNTNDKQACQVKDLLVSLYQKKTSIDILDYGAGSGRIPKCIHLMLEDKADDVLETMANKMKYHIYDKYGISEDFAPNQGWHGNAFDSEAELKNNAKKYDVIVLFNVLHEVSIDEWEQELNFIFELLTQDGVVLFGERRILSVGEKPFGKSGYLVLGDREVSCLFRNLQVEKRNLPTDDKTICYAITKRFEKEAYIDETYIKQTLRCLENRCRKEIKRFLKGGKGKLVRSRDYAFYCQQYLNAQEALEILDSEQIKKKRKYKGISLEHILSLNISMSEKKEYIRDIAQLDTEDGRKCKEYLKRHKGE